MNHDLVAGMQSLPKNGLRRLPMHAGDRIECVAGCLWLTQDGDPRDVVLEAGAAFVSDRPGGALAHALSDARFLVLSA